MLRVFDDIAVELESAGDRSGLVATDAICFSSAL
jgi:hypothetical protein